jgi:putative DNA primase/helicase
LNITAVKEKADGRWPDIMKRLGIDVGESKHHGPCPVCGGTKPFRWDNLEDRGTWICNHCGAGDGWKLVQNVKRVDFKRAIEIVAGVIDGCEVISQKPRIDRNAGRAIYDLLKTAKKVRHGDYVSRYLLARGLSVIPPHLGQSIHCYESETKREQIAMLAVFTGANGGKVTIHRTYLTDKGQKLDIQSPRKIMPVCGKMAGGAVRLFDFKEGALGICEGIETAIAAHELFGMPVWASLSATLLKQFEPPATVTELHIFVDNDLSWTGHAAAFTLANRLAVKGVNVSPHIPDGPGMDFLDVLNERRDSKSGKV